MARIQHHPARSHLLTELQNRLSPLLVEVKTHSSDPPDPWSGYRACLSDLPDCSHVLVIQDDAQPVPNFSRALEQIAITWPSIPVCLYLGSMPRDPAIRAGRALGKKTYIPLGLAQFMPLVAVLWPKLKAQEFLYWANYNKTTRADDGNAAKWVRRTKQEIMVTVPSLVQHDPDLPSVKGTHNPGNWSRALYLAEDALDYEW